ncbi:hypothetical protein DITRI_Ditri16bG0039900 [Diplodiscus trichospermus]
MDEILLYSLISAAFLLFVVKFLLQTRTRLKNLPPSPFALPVLGHLHLVKEPLHCTLLSLSRKYGPIFYLRFGSHPVVVVSSPSAVEECFGKNDIIFANRPRFVLGKYVGYNYTDLGLSPYGAHWRNLRRLVTLELFSSNSLKTSLSIRREEINLLLRKLYRISAHGFAKVELKSMFSELVFIIIMRMIAGKRYYGEEVTAVEEAREFRELIEELFELAESDPEYYTDKIIKGLVLVMLNAGVDTTAITLEWAMSNLLNHPQLLEKARIELNTQVGQEQLVEETDLPKLQYLQNIISETLRLYPPAPLLVPHFASDYCTLGRYDIPPNSILLVNALAIQRDPKFWDDPTSFKPERFENSEKEGGDNIQKQLPFGLRRSLPWDWTSSTHVRLDLGFIDSMF